MSPVASILTAFAFSAATPSLAHPDIVGQSASTMSRYLAGTGFTAVAIVSVASYSYHGRGAADNPRGNSVWVTSSSFLSFMRYRRSGMITAQTASHWPPDVEGGFDQYVSMVYARVFHPMSWNLVECHPATGSAPAIYVEDEASERPASEPKPYSMNSFLDMNDDDGDGNGDKKASAKAVLENANQAGKPRVAKTPPYRIPRKHEDGSFNASSPEKSSGSELDTYSAYDRTLSKSKIDLAFPPSDGILKTPQMSQAWLPSWHYPTDSHPNINCLAYDGTPTAPMGCTRRYGMADMADLAQTLKQGILEDGSSLGLCDLTDFDDTDSETDLATSYRHLERIETTSNKAISLNCDVGVHDNCDGIREDWSDGNMFVPPHKSPTLMRRILGEPLSPNMRTLSKHNDFEFSEDDIIDNDEGNVTRLTPAWGLARLGRILLEWTSSTTRTENDVSNDRSVPLHCPRGLPHYSWAIPALTNIAWHLFLVR